ncbi:hypothetical protein T09_8589 [Trichinella sp. T9]|nr:hypothetical protein T09_8589 [Trichinella sp. T9]
MICELRIRDWVENALMTVAVISGNGGGISHIPLLPHASTTSTAEKMRACEESFFEGDPSGRRVGRGVRVYEVQSCRLQLDNLNRKIDKSILPASHCRSID